MNESPMGLAILGVISVFLAVWGMLTARDPKRWRQWWMAVLSLTDMETTREQRRRQEFFLSIGGYVAFSLFLGVSAISAYFVVISVQEQRQARSDYDKERDKATSDFQKMRNQKDFRKL